VGDIAITKSELKAMNKSDLASYYDSKIDGIPANLEVFHQLHCLVRSLLAGKPCRELDSTLLCLVANISPASI
jgi:hypothetical protein